MSHLPSFIRLRSLRPFYYLDKIVPGPRQTKMDHGRSKGELSPRSLGTGGDVRMKEVTWNAKNFKTKCYDFCLRASCHSLVVHLQKSLIDYYFLPLSACHLIFALYLAPVFIHVGSFQTCYADLVRKVISSAILIRLWDKKKYVRITLSFFTTSSAEEEGRLFSSLLPIAFRISGSVIVFILGFSESGGRLL